MAKQKEIIEKSGKLNEVIIVETKRPNGTLRIQQDFSFCPSLAEQHTAHLSDLNYLIARYKPDELAAYVAARAAHRPEILGHDFSIEPSMQDSKNVVYLSRKIFDSLSDDVKMQFKNHLEFFKFIDNPDNQDKMIKLGLVQKKDVEALNDTKPTIEQPVQDKNTNAKAERSDNAKAT